jgi:hypothetical protein
MALAIHRYKHNFDFEHQHNNTALDMNIGAEGGWTWLELKVGTPGRHIMDGTSRNFKAFVGMEGTSPFAQGLNQHQLIYRLHIINCSPLLPV